MQSRDEDLFSLVVHDSVNVDDDALVRSGLDGFYKLFLGSPICPDRAFLVKLSQVPDIIAARGFSWQLELQEVAQLTCRIQYRRFIDCQLGGMAKHPANLHA